MSRSMNAEAVFSDLVDVVLKASREAPTEHVSREAFYRTVLGDVAHAAAGGGAPALPTGDERATAGDGKTRYNAHLHTIKSPEVTAFQANVEGHKVTAVVQHILGGSDKWVGSLHLEGETMVYFIPKKSLGRNALEWIIKYAVKGYCGKLGKSAKLRRNKAKKAARTSATTVGGW